MTIENLVTEARAAGLQMRCDGELLRITGARKNTALAKELLDRKAEVVEFLAASPDSDDAKNPELPAHIRDGLAREGIQTVTDEYGPRLTMKMSGELYIAVANYRRGRYLAGALRRHSDWEDE